MAVIGANPRFTGAKKVTLRPEYEHFGETTTVGGYLRALANAREPGRPADYEDYLHQRVPSVNALLDAPADINIDDYGLVSPWLL